MTLVRYDGSFETFGIVSPSSNNFGFTVAEAIQDVSQELNIVGQKVSEADFILFFNRANKYFYTNYKMPTTQRSKDMLLFDGVYEYGVPEDLIGFIEPERPLGLTQLNFYHNTQKEFVTNRTGNKTAFSFNQDSQYLLANIEVDTLINTGKNYRRQLINNCDSLTDNGSWSVSGDGSNLAVDTQIFTEGAGSLRFLVTASSGVTVLENSGLNPLNLEDQLINGYIFLDLDSPDETTISEVRLRWGSDSSNYYEVVSNSRYRGDNINGGFGQIGFDLSSKTTTGAPDDANLSYIRIQITHGLSDNGFYRIDNIFVTNPIYFKLPYYSRYNIKTEGGVYKEKITLTSDIIMAPFEAYEAYTYKVAEYAAVLKLNDDKEANYFRGELFEKETYLRSKYPNQEPRTQNTYYKQPNKF